MSKATLLISSKNYSSWSLRGFLLAKLSGIDFMTESVALDDPRAHEELLMRTSSILVPCLLHDDVTVWDTLAIAEYLNELFPKAQMLPREKIARARCRSISGEMH
ncbi:MAG TPA: glutathione S-transferase N-terminal domain-containing protein, partial [Acidocella sp.]|nr:glutathione S-transferase N-terminal domain-containing protein [Acidocella sp.]